MSSLRLLVLLLGAHACAGFVARSTGSGSIGIGIAPKCSPGFGGMAPLTSPTSSSPPGSSPSSLSAVSSFELGGEEDRSQIYERQRQDWIQRSVDYYSKVMREERRRTIGQLPDYDTQEYQEDFLVMARRHYFAIEKVRTGKYSQAETLYRRIIDELMGDDDQCDHAKLAVTTLLLALLTKRMKDPKKTRSVFLQFFRLAVLEREEGTECACSAKVLQAYALFEMQQGNSLKSLEIVKKALQFDSSLAPVLKWQQFQRAAMAQQASSAGYNKKMKWEQFQRAAQQAPGYSP